MTEYNDEIRPLTPSDQSIREKMLENAKSFIDLFESIKKDQLVAVTPEVAKAFINLQQEYDSVLNFQSTSDLEEFEKSEQLSKQLNESCCCLSASIYDTLLNSLHNNRMLNIHIEGHREKKLFETLQHFKWADNLINYKLILEAAKLGDVATIKYLLDEGFCNSHQRVRLNNNELSLLDHFKSLKNISKDKYNESYCILLDNLAYHYLNTLNDDFPTFIKIYNKHTNNASLTEYINKHPEYALDFYQSEYKIAKVINYYKEELSAFLKEYHGNRGDKVTALLNHIEQADNDTKHYAKKLPNIVQQIADTYNDIMATRGGTSWFFGMMGSEAGKKLKELFLHTANNLKKEVIFSFDSKTQKVTLQFLSDNSLRAKL